MCLNKRWVKNKYNGKKYFVSCGTCPACLQVKAGKRANRIINNFSKDKVCLFCHFTYANDCLPYITWSDILKYKEFDEKEEKFHTVVKTIRNEEKRFYLLPLYRDSVNRRVRFSRYWNTSKRRTFNSKIKIDVIPFEVGVIKTFDYWQKGYHHPTNHNIQDSLSVSYFKDIQNFIKRLRAYVNYHKEIFTTSEQSKFEYFICSEYGENYSRSHFHALLWVSRCKVKEWKHAIADNWLFDDYDFTYKNIEIAKKPAAYVSTYVNSNIDLPLLLQQPAVRQTYTYSEHFGFGNHAFSFEEVLKSISKGKAEYYAKFVGKDGVCNFKSISIPCYVTNYYFPKFKGMSSLTTYEAFNVLENPFRLGAYARKCGIQSKNELNKIVKFLINKRNQFYEYTKNNPINFHVEDSLLSPTFKDTFAYWSLNCHSARKRSQWFSFFDNQKDPFSIIYSYDNFADTFDKIEHKSFEYLDFFQFECDPNLYPDNLAKHDYLLNQYYLHNKSHKVKNEIWQTLIKIQLTERNSNETRLICQ